MLEEHGLLPNYTLLDDSVTLDVGLSWTDPDTSTYQTEHAQFQRGSAQAIREFAPGATFYARGWEITIDAVDLGVDRCAIRPWVFCPACGYAVDIAAEGTEQQVPGLPAMRQRRHRRHRPAARRRRADPRDGRGPPRRGDDLRPARQRDSRAFQVVTAADVDPAQIARRWFVEDVGSRAAPICGRWICAGSTSASPATATSRTIAGAEYSGALFRVCAGCGKLDTDAGRNLPHEHRPWCRYRTATDEHTEHRCALPDAAHPGPAVAAAQRRDDGRRLRRAQPGRSCAARPARAARRASRPHPHRARRRPHPQRRLRQPRRRPAARRRARAAPATSPTSPSPAGSMRCCALRGSGSATANAATRSVRRAIAACCHSWHPRTPGVCHGRRPNGTCAPCSASVPTTSQAAGTSRRSRRPRTPNRTWSSSSAR